MLACKQLMQRKVRCGERLSRVLSKEIATCRSGFQGMSGDECGRGAGI